MTQTTIRGGRRMSTAVCYLDPARRRPNLKIQANALTECLLFDGKRCVGVRYTLGGQQYEARADREAVVSADSINSPQLLELSARPPYPTKVRTNPILNAGGHRRFAGTPCISKHSQQDIRRLNLTRMPHYRLSLSRL